MKKIFLAVIVSLFCSGAQSQNRTGLGLIPTPAQLKVNSGQFVINENTKLVLATDNQEMQSIAGSFNELLNRAAGYRLQVITAAPATNAIVCKLNPGLSNPEGYKLSVQNNLI
jgi:hypothetical protein